jgi:hypothetical protein
MANQTNPERVINVKHNPALNPREHFTAHTIRYLSADRRVKFDLNDAESRGLYINVKGENLYLDDHTCHRIEQVRAGWEDPGRPSDISAADIDDDDEPDDEPPAPVLPSEIRVRILPGERAQLRDERGELVTFTPDPGKRRLPSMETLIRRVFGAHLDPDPRMRPIYKVRTTATGAIFRLRTGVECQAAYWAGTP